MDSELNDLRDVESESKALGPTSEGDEKNSMGLLLDDGQNVESGRGAGRVR